MSCSFSQGQTDCQSWDKEFSPWDRLIWTVDPFAFFFSGNIILFLGSSEYLFTNDFLAITVPSFSLLYLWENMECSSYLPDMWVKIWSGNFEDFLSKSWPAEVGYLVALDTSSSSIFITKIKKKENLNKFQWKKNLGRMYSYIFSLFSNYFSTTEIHKKLNIFEIWEFSK